MAKSSFLFSNEAAAASIAVASAFISGCGTSSSKPPSNSQEVAVVHEIPDTDAAVQALFGRFNRSNNSNQNQQAQSVQPVQSQQSSQFWNGPWGQPWDNPWGNPWGQGGQCPPVVQPGYEGVQCYRGCLVPLYGEDPRVLWCSDENRNVRLAPGYFYSVRAGTFGCLPGDPLYNPSYGEALCRSSINQCPPGTEARPRNADPRYQTIYCRRTYSPYPYPSPYPNPGPIPPGGGYYPPSSQICTWVLGIPVCVPTPPCVTCGPRGYGYPYGANLAPAQSTPKPGATSKAIPEAVISNSRE